MTSKEFLQYADLPDLHNRHQEVRIQMSKLGEEYDAISRAINERASEQEKLVVEAMTYCTIPDGRENERRDFRTKLTQMGVNDLKEHIKNARSAMDQGRQ